MSAPRRGGSLLVVALALAGVLTLTGSRLAASQQTVLTARESTDAVPARDPWDPFWDDLPRVDVPLSAQQVTAPMGGRRWTMTARALQHAGTLYLELEWEDPHPDRSVDAPQLFTDAAAVQFPEPAATTVPALCMGDATAAVNIWQWKAAWQRDVHLGFQGDVRTQYPDARVDEYPFHGDDLFYAGRAAGNPFSQDDRASAVDNLIAGGFGTLTADPTPVVQGWGAWRDGRWRVVFQRPLAVGREGNVDLGTDDWTDVAFAVWDGAAGERDGMKSVANFVSLDVSSEPMPRAGGFPFWPASFFVFLGLWGAFAWLLVGWKPWRRASS
jgi:hypothetical protein